MDIEKIKTELKKPLVDFMDWYRTHPEYENVVSSVLVELWIKSFTDEPSAQAVFYIAINVFGLGEVAEPEAQQNY